jgi:hypothetical protein
MRGRPGGAFIKVLVAAVFMALAATPAHAYVIELEPAAPSSLTDTREPYPEAWGIGGPDVSRAIYGYLAPDEGVDAFEFTVEETVTSELAVLVPDEPDTADFRPVATVFSDDRLFAVLGDAGVPERPEHFDTFAGTRFLRGGTQGLTFEPGVRYVVAVAAGAGAVQAGPYVVLMTGRDSFSFAQLLDVPRVYLGMYGQRPFRWSVLLTWALLAVAVALLIRGRRRRVRSAGPRAEPRDIFGL